MSAAPTVPDADHATAMGRLAGLPLSELTTVVREGGRARIERLTRTIAGIRFDWAKTHLDEDVLAAGHALADAAGYRRAVQRLFAGETVNPSEGRAATHVAERGEGAPEDVGQAAMLHRRMRQLVDAVEAGAFGPVRHVLHLGIGGSALGPKLVVEALAPRRAHVDVRVVANVDGTALARAVEGLDPSATLIVVASKTFTTTETLRNAASARDWLARGGVADPLGRFVALTAAPEKAAEWGIDDTRILPFADTVGGRYSLWSAIGFPIALALGWPAFEELLEGAAEVDRHVRLSAPGDNVALLAAIADQFYVQAAGCQTRAVFAYDERLGLLPAYLQQLEMESNGKSVSATGAALSWPTAPVTWGGVGTDAQHAVFQLLHQGSWLVPVEFLAARQPGHGLDPDHHDQLLSNCVAQGAALLAGQGHDDPARRYPGGRPSATILLPDVTPHALGALLAFYEHRVFANAVLLGINPFDQFGVELGKTLAKGLMEAGSLPTGTDAASEALWEALHD